MLAVTQIYREIAVMFKKVTDNPLSILIKKHE